MTDDLDLRIQALLRAPHRAADERFVDAVRLEVEAEARLSAARAAARREFAGKASAFAAVIAAFLLLGRIEPPATADHAVALLSPAMLGFILLGLWAVIDLPAAGRARPFAP